MKLNIVNLGSILESGEYIHNGEKYSIEQGKEYFLQTEGIGFNCKVIYNKNEGFFISEINGKKPTKYKYFYNIKSEEMSFNIEEVVKDISFKYKYVPSLEYFNMLLLYLPGNNISCHGSIYEGGILLGSEKILLCHESKTHYKARIELGLKKGAYDIVTEIDFEDILDIDFSTIKDKILLDIFTKRGTISIVSDLNSDPDLDSREIFRTIKKFLISGR